MTDTGELVPLPGGWVFSSCTSHRLPSGETVYCANTKARDDLPPLHTHVLGAWALTPDDAIAGLQRFVQQYVDVDEGLT